MLFALQSPCKIIHIIDIAANLGGFPFWEMLSESVDVSYKEITYYHIITLQILNSNMKSVF